MRIVEKDIHCGCHLVCCRLLNLDFELRIIFVDSKVQYVVFVGEFRCVVWWVGCVNHI